MYQQLLKSKGLKSTLPRTMILNTIEKNGHINIDELFENFKKSEINVPLATLYRILGELSSVGILNTVTIADAKPKYEITKGEHPHFLCEECGHLEDLQVAMNDIVEIAQNACSHSTNSVSVMLHGTCKECSSKAT